MSACKSVKPFNYLHGLKKQLIYPLQLNTKFCHAKFVMEDRPVEKSIHEKLKTRLNPLHLSILNESNMHNVPKGSETHFKVFVVSQEFENMALLNRHRLVNSILEEELKNGVHALSIIAKTPSQWDQKEGINPSPKCLGGFGANGNELLDDGFTVTKQSKIQKKPNQLTIAG